MFEDRKQHPRDDMFTDLLNAEIVDDDGQPRRLTDSELTEFGPCSSPPGTETVARHLGWAVDLLDQYPEQRAELAADPTLVDERGRGDPALRAAVTGERPLDVTRDVTVQDVTIPASRRSCC